MHKALRITLIVLVSFTIVIFLAGLIAPFFLEDHFERKLEEEFSTRTENQYQLEIGNLNIGIWSRSVTTDSIIITPKTESPVIKNISVGSISINGIGWLSLLGSNPKINSITISNPDLVLYENFTSFSFSGSESESNGEIERELPDFDLHIIDAKAKITTQKSGEVFSIEAFDLDAYQINANAIAKDSAEYYVKSLSFSGQDFSYYMSDKLYRFTIEEFKMNNEKQFFSVNNFAVKPVLPKYEFAKNRGKQLDRIDLKISEIEMRGYEIDSIPHGAFNLDTLIIREGWLEVFRDKHQPKAPGFSQKPLVNEMANSIKYPISLGVALISNSTIIYEEHKPPSEESGHISFDALDATLRDFNSATHPDFPDDTLKLYVETRFMDAALLTVDVVYPVFNEDDTHYLKTHLESINPKEVSDMIQNVGFAQIESGMVQELSAEMELNDSSSSGEVKLLYNDLELSFLDEDDPEKNGIKEKVGDFFLNKFVIKSENTPDDPRIGEIDYERDEGKSIFAYWWKSLQSGMMDSIK